MKGIDLTGKIALVCGAGAGGIGSATSRMLIESGATLFAIDRDQALVDALEAELGDLDGRFAGMAADLTDREQAGAILPAVKARFGRLDCLVNIAGGNPAAHWRAFEDATDDLFDDSISLNLGYVFCLCRDAGRLMIDAGQGGAIVNVASISAFAGAPYHGVYGAAKAGVMALGRTMASEWHRHGIRVNAVAPGTVRTPRMMASSGGHLGSGRPSVTPDQVASAILFLLSDLAAGVSGQTLLVDGGISTAHPCGTLAEFELTSHARSSD